MSYDHQLLQDTVLSRLRRAPSCLLGDLSRELCVSRRTIQKAVSTATGKTFRHFREEMLVERVRIILASNPMMSVKELSFVVGFKSPSSFSRAIKRACLCCPEELRSRMVRELH
jgi:AraC family transcriptional regulator